MLDTLFTEDFLDMMEQYFNYYNHNSKCKKLNTTKLRNLVSVPASLHCHRMFLHSLDAWRNNIEVLEFANISSVSRKKYLNGDSAIAIIEMSLKYFIFSFLCA